MLRFLAVLFFSITLPVRADVWVDEDGVSAVKIEDGVLTPTAAEWSGQLANVSPDDIKKGIDALTMKYREFPPNAMSFKDLCIGSEWDEVLDEIFCKLQDSSHAWKNQIAFNVWYFFGYNPSLNQTMETIAKKCKEIYERMDITSMFPLPDTSVKELEKPVEPVISTSVKKEKRVFQSYLMQVITDTKPELFECDEIQSASQREFNREPMHNLPPLMKKLFSHDGSIELMNKFKSKGYIMPDAPVKPDFFTKDDGSYQTKFKQYSEKVKQAITNFLHEEGVFA